MKNGVRGIKMLFLLGVFTLFFILVVVFLLGVILKDLFSDKKIYNPPINRKQTYQEFLQSPQWQNLRKDLIEKNRKIHNLPIGKFKCVWCKRGEEDNWVNVHHTSYRHGLLNPKYLRVICRNCHDWWHNKRNKKRG